MPIRNNPIPAGKGFAGVGQFFEIHFHDRPGLFYEPGSCFSRHIGGVLGEQPIDEWFSFFVP